MSKTQEALVNEAQLLPTKDTLTALKSDVNLESACLELCDNALDAWKRSSDRKSKATISIEVTEREDWTELIIRDNAGGVPRENAAMLFGLGHTAKEEISGSIGTYGVGAKKSLVNLGLPFRISSRDVDEPSGWSYRITPDWFEDDQDWSVEVYEDTDIQPGVTEIRIEDLNYEWDEETAEALRTRLGAAYNLFLSEEMQALHGTTYDLTILVNGTPVNAEGMPDWSYSPFDDLHPRRFENIRIENPSFDDSITAHITVGLLTKKDSQRAGTDIYCQKRKVASGLRNDIGGFGTGQDHLGNFSARHERLRVILELETEGDGQRLPWDTQKSTIDKHSPVMRGTQESRGVYNWFRRSVQAYFECDADKVPQAFLEPFGSDHHLAVNGGQPVTLDYSDRTHIVTDHRPNTELPDVTEIQEKAIAHSVLMINCEHTLEPWQRNVYRAQLDRESDRNVENLTQVDSCPPDDVNGTVHQTAGMINELARIHYEHGISYPDGVPAWAVPRYEDYLQRHDERAYSAVESVPNGVPGSLTDLEEAELEALASANRMGPEVYSEKTIDDETAHSESAELFLVFGGESDDERAAKVLDMSRTELCRRFDLDDTVSDDVVWELLRTELEETIRE